MKMQKVKAKAQAAALKQTGQQVRRKSEKYVIFIALQKMWGRWTQVNDLMEWFEKWNGACGMLYLLVNRGEQAMPSFGRHSKDPHRALGNPRPNTELEFWWTTSAENIWTGQITSANAPYQRRSVSSSNMFCWWVYTSPTRDMRTTTLSRCSGQSRTSRIPKRRTYKMREGTFSQRWPREETRWRTGWWYKISQHSTRCTEKRLKSKQSVGHQNGTDNSWTMYWLAGNICTAAETVKQPTSSTWEATTEVLWHNSW